MNTILYPAEISETWERGDSERYCCFVGSHLIALGSDPIFAEDLRDLGMAVGEKLQEGWSGIVYNPPVDQIITENGRVLSLCALGKGCPEESLDGKNDLSDRERFVNGLLNR